MTRVIVDRKVLDGFKGRALRALPNEYIEEVWGRIRGTDVQVFVLGAMRHLESTPTDVEAEETADFGDGADGLQLLGTIHTHIHPDPAEPSRFDVRSFKENGEIVMGIMSVKKTAKRRFSSTAFYHGRKKLELLISE